MTDQQRLKEALARFETKITLSPGTSEDLIYTVARENPELMFYVESISVGGRRVGFLCTYTYEIRYRHTDLQARYIHLVQSEAQVDRLLCEYVGRYRKQLVIIAPQHVNVEGTYQSFMETDAPFYSNLIGIQFSWAREMVCVPMQCFVFSFGFRIGRVKLEMMQEQTNAEVERIARLLFLPGMNEETKAFLAHNYLASTVRYSDEDHASPLERSYLQSAYGALINKRCVCQGYAQAYKLLMDYAHVPCEIVTGQIRGSSEHHAWNLLRLRHGTENFHVDVTWDSPDGGGVRFAYFGKRDHELEGERTWNHEYIPRCNAARDLLASARNGVNAFRAPLRRNRVGEEVLGDVNAF